MTSFLTNEFPNYHILQNIILAFSPPDFNALGCLDQILQREGGSWKISPPLSATTRQKKPSAYRVKDLHNLKLLTNFVVNLTSSPGESYEINTCNTLFVTPSGVEDRLASKFVRSFSL